MTLAWIIKMIQVNSSSCKGLESLFVLLCFDWNHFTINSTFSLAQLTDLQIAMHRFASSNVARSQKLLLLLIKTVDRLRNKYLLSTQG